MSVGSGGLGTVYSRLPQSTSDIETSEDEVSQHENLIFYRKMGTPKKANLKKEEAAKTTMKDYQPLGRESAPVENQEVHINGFSNINYNYAHGTGGPGTEEETMVLGTLGASGSSSKKEGDGRHGNLEMLVGSRHPMSMMRQVAFVMSLCLCIFVIVAFLWVLPCNWSTCPIMQYDKQTGSSWEKTLLGLELIGGINVVPSGNEQHNNLLFMIRGEINFPDQGKERDTTTFAKPVNLTGTKEGRSQIPPGGGGLIALMGSSGVVAWYTILHSVPRDMDCSLVDLNGDGKTDCLLIGSNHLMYAFEPISSTKIWYLNVENNTNYIPSDMEFPLILPDVDNDKILDLAIACRMLKQLTNSNEKIPSISSKSAHNRIAMVSGKTGKLIGNAFVDELCHTVYKLAVDKNWSITYRCVDFAGKESVKDISLNALYKWVSGINSSQASVDYSKHLGGLASLKQHVLYQNYGPPELIVGNGEPKLQTNKPSTYIVHGKKLTILNQGHCPEDCIASARVYDEKKNSSIWNDGGKNVYALRPAVLLFNSQSSGPGSSEKSEGSNSDALFGIASGFAVKFWHWTNCDKSSIWYSQRKRQKRLSKEKDWGGIMQTKDQWHDGTTETKNPEYIESREYRIDNLGINTTTRSLSRNASSVTVTYHPREVYNPFCLKERIVLITFNDTDPHLVNASESEIKQLCSNSACQPSLPYQEQSLIIADLDGDGSKELVSYLTTYETEDDGKTSGSDRLTLVSKVRVVRLEAELPKLYEAVTHL